MVVYRKPGKNILGRKIQHLRLLDKKKKKPHLLEAPIDSKKDAGVVTSAYMGPSPQEAGHGTGDYSEPIE